MYKDRLSVSILYLSFVARYDLFHLFVDAACTPFSEIAIADSIKQNGGAV